MDTGELLTRWTARLAMSLYVLALAGRGTAWGRRTCLGLGRWIWTAGCFIFLLHLVCAFHFFHHWSHAEAYAAIARQTAEVVGLDWGGGLYLNYVFTLVWLADVGWWWLGLGRYEERPRIVEWTVQAFMAFIAFNATVVFGTETTRWAGVAAGLLLIGIWTRRVFTGKKSMTLKTTVPRP
jgi:hypothetical protein